MPKPCIEPSCGRLTRGTRCTEHERERQKRRNAAVQYRRTAAWQRLSKEAREAHPWCSRCGAAEDLTTDHVISRSLEAGVVVLCRECNGRKQ